MNTTAENNVTETAALPAAAQTAKLEAPETSKPSKEAKAPALKIAGNVVTLEAIQKRVDACNSTIGRAVKTAENAGIVKIAKDISGGGRAIVGTAQARELHRLNLLHTDKKKSAEMLAEIIGLNQVMDGLESLGLVRRKVQG